MLLRDLRMCPLGLWLVVIPLALIASTVAADEIPSPGEGTEEVAAVDFLDEVEGDADGAPSEEPSSSDIETIRITANRRSEDIQKAAVSVTALEGSFIEEVGLTNFADIEKFTPNLQIIQGGDSRSTSIRIRGIGSVGGNAGIDPSVGVFVDGVYQGRAGMSVQDLMDIESVEVLRGPQGTLYGKNTAAGALKVTSRRPNYEPSAMLEFVAGRPTPSSVTRGDNYRNIEGRFTGNIPLIDGVLATRLTGYGVTRDGYDTNVSPNNAGKDVNDTVRWGLRSSTLWDVTDDLHVLVRADYAETREDCCVPDVWKYGETGDVVLPTSTEQLAAAKGITLQPAIRGDRKVTADQTPRNDISVGGVSAEVDLDRWDHSISLLTAYRHYTSDSLLDGDFTEMDVITWDTEVEFDQLSAELRAVSPRFDYFDYVSGLYLFYSALDTFDVLGFQDDAFVLFRDSVNTGTNTHRTTSIAGFADSNVYISEWWDNEPKITLTGGIRVGWERKDHKGSQISTGPLADIGLETAVSGPDAFSDQSEDDTYVTGRIIIKWEPEIEWDPVGDVMLYTSYATGYKSAGYNQLRTQGQDDEPLNLFFAHEESQSGEVGLRTAWLDRIITFNITAFYTDYKDFQAQVFDGFGIRVINAGSFETYGFEADLTLMPIEGWMTLFSAGYTKTNYKDFERGPCQQGSPLGCEQDLTGRPLDNTPLWNLSLFTSYEDSVSEEVNWFVMMNYNYQSRRFLNASLDPFLRVAPTNSLGFRAGLRHPAANWEVNFWVKNVTNEDVWAIGFDVPTLGGYAAFQLPPRTFGGMVRLKF